MCLILFGYKVSKAYPLILAANRDEFFQRQTAPMHYWENNPDILAGKDLEQGGTWLGVHKKSGRFAALTNYRDPFSIKQNAPSRGEIIIDFLETNVSISRWADTYLKQANAFNGFILISGDKNDVFWFSNIKKTIENILPGIHGLSNRFLDTPWPKIQTGKSELENIINKGVTAASLFTLLKNNTVPKDELLPETGVGLEWERILSPLFIQSDTYGTRSSTVILTDHKGKTDIIERTYTPNDVHSYSDQHFCLP